MHKAKTQSQSPTPSSKNGDYEQSEKTNANELTKTEQRSKSDASTPTSHKKQGTKKDENANAQKKQKPSLINTFAPNDVKGFDWKLLLCGALGGAITIYVCMFLFKYKLNDLLLMIVMPVFSAVNGYLWFLLFSSRFFIGA